MSAAALRNELLVRCLDAWTPTALHGHKRVTYVDCSADGCSASTALRVFAEFADLLDQHTLTMVSFHAPAGEVPPGVVIRTVADLPEGSAQALAFGTSTEKALEKFKDELWALDEYAGVRLRNPGDPDGTLLDISVRPNPAPVRRCLIGQVRRTGGLTVTQLRSWALRETIFRVSDVTKVLQALVNAAAVGREPSSGRLSPTTQILPADH